MPSGQEAGDRSLHVLSNECLELFISLSWEEAGARDENHLVLG